MVKRFEFPPSDLAQRIEGLHPHLTGMIQTLQAIEKESDRGMVLTLTGFMEEVLERLLTTFLRNDIDHEELFEKSGGALSTFSARTRMAHALGLISNKEHQQLHLIRRVRNDFAHEPAVSFKLDEVANRVLAISRAGGHKEESRTTREQFQFAAIIILVGILRRLEYFKSRKLGPMDPRLESIVEDVDKVPPDAKPISHG